MVKTKHKTLRGNWVILNESAVKALRKAGAYMKGDERILGDGDFVENMLLQAKENLKRKYHLAAEGYDFDKVVDRVAFLMDLKREQILSAGKYKQLVAARRVVCYWCTRELGMNQVVLAQKFGMSQPAISMAVKWGEQVANLHGFSLLDT